MTKREHDQHDSSESESENDSNEETEKKKAKIVSFSVKEFRIKLKNSDESEEKSQTTQEALNAFLEVCNSDSNVRYTTISDYFNAGGSCLEMLQILESTPSIPAVVPIELVTHLLLQVVAAPIDRNQQHATLEACRYFLNAHLPLINKMTHLCSTANERLAILKLLTGMVAFSPFLVKDILLNVKFHVGLMTQHNADNDVRGAFINFLLAFFVDEHYPTILQVCYKPYLIMSVFTGLMYDDSATVQMFLITLKRHIIDNPAIKKPLKIGIFNVAALRGLVALYSWKGPECYDFKKRKAIDGETNADEQQQIAQLTHECLLVLCTSIKHGVVFCDQSLGTDRRHRNPLMYTVLQAIGETFVSENKLRTELVIKMAAACPDLVKTVWNKLQPSLELRPTTTWLDAIRFLHRLIDEMDPISTTYRAKLLTPLQYAQVIQVFVTPTLILERILPEDFKFEHSQVRLQVIIAIKKVLQGVSRYLDKAEEILPVNYYRTLKSLLGDFLIRNMPTSKVLTKGWSQPLSEANLIPEFPQFSRIEYMNEVLDVLHLYNRLIPEHLLDMKFDQPMQLLQDIKIDKNDESNMFKIKFIQLVQFMDPDVFTTTNDMFPECILLLSKCLRGQETEDAARRCLSSIFHNTGLFEENGGSYEMRVWIDALKHKRIPVFLAEVLLQAQEQSELLQQELYAVRAFTDVDAVDAENMDEIIKDLSEGNYESTMGSLKIKHIQVSGVTLMALKSEASKAIHPILGQIFLDVFHLQTDYKCFQKLVATHRENVPEEVMEYIVDWPNHQEPERVASENCMLDIQELSRTVFKLVHRDDHTEEVYNQLLSVAKQYPIPDLIYSHPILLKHFKPADSASMCTNFLIDYTDHLKSINVEVNTFVKPYQGKLNETIFQLLESKKEKKISNELLLIKVINFFGVSYDDCYNILKKVATLNGADFLNDENKPNRIYTITVMMVHHFAKVCQQDYTLKAFEEITNIVDVLIHLNGINLDTSELANAIHQYFNRFSHQSQLKKDELFVSVACRKEFCKENAQLIMGVLEHGPLPAELFSQHLESVCSKKGLILPILDRFATGFNEELGKKTFAKLLSTLQKVLLKPQKAGQHLEKHYKGMCHLIQLFIPTKDTLKYLDKIQKPDTTEIFLPCIFKSMFIKYMKEDAKTSDVVEKHVNNSILTFVHFMVNIFKVSAKKSQIDQDADFATVQEVSKLLGEVLKELPSKKMKFEILRTNETFKLFQKFCLKHGIGCNREYLMTILTDLSKLCKFTLDEAVELTEMMMGHSEFMNTILCEIPSKAKLAIFEFIYVLAKCQPGVMQSHHVPMLLSAYTATMHPSDRRLLSLLKLYEAAPAQTCFYDFKPFLWGLSAGNFYSVRMDSRQSLRKQPRTDAVLDILEQTMIKSTIKSIPLGLPLRDTRFDTCIPDSAMIYDISFILSVFSQLLAPELTLRSYKFTRSGAPSLIVVALASHNKEVRMAACHVLARFYNLLQSEKIGKDHIVWIRFVEALAKGTGAIESFKLNNFAAIFMANTALVLSNPLEPMYLPLSNYIAVKSTPVLTKIPELYTFLNSSDVDNVTHRHFILQILADGMRTEQDFEVALKSNAFKLIMELCNSCICDQQTSMMILDILEKATAISQGAKTLCQNHGLLMWLHNMLLRHTNVDIQHSIIKVFHNVLNCSKVEFGLIEFSLGYFIDNTLLDLNIDDVWKVKFIQTCLLVTQKCDFLTKDRLQKIVSFADSNTCDYFLNFNVSTTIKENESDENLVEVVTHQLIQTWLNH